MTFHPEILGQRQRTVLRQLAPLATAWDFYLGGGTALALQLGHRRSVDLDWFTPRRLSDPLALAQRLREAARVSGIRVSFLEYRYDLLQPLLPWSRYSVQLASLADLGTMKLVALGQRGAKKDFVDLFALCHRRMSLRELLACYRSRYHVEDIAHLLFSLVFFDDADKERMPALLHKTSWKTVKRSLREWVQHLSDV